MNDKTHKFKETSAVSILDLFQGEPRFIVPRFQRNYSWDKEKVEALWIDLIENFSHVNKFAGVEQEFEYFLGSIVLVKGTKSSEFYVIDGQQRLATLTMLFCVVRDIIQDCISLLESNFTNDFVIDTNALIEYNKGSEQYWKLVLNNTDKSTFEKIQKFEKIPTSQYKQFKDRLEKTSKKKDTTSQRFLKENYIFLHDRLVESITKNFDIRETQNESKMPYDETIQKWEKQHFRELNRFIDYIIKYNFLVKIVVADNTTAFQIFETLNERGETLASANLIKNHILNQVKIESKQKELSDTWDNIINDIIRQGQNDDEFIMESRRSRCPVHKKYKTSIKNLYKIIGDEIKDLKTCEKYIEELEVDAKFLSKLNEPESYPDSQSKENIFALQSLNAKFMRTPILAAYREWGKNNHVNKKFTSEYRDLVDLLVKFFFKFRIVRRGSPGKIEQIIFEITKIIHDQCDTPKDALHKIREEIEKHDDHENFLANFEKFMESPKTGSAKYVLQQIALHYLSEPKEIMLMDDLTLEHILPKKYETNWNKSDFFKGYKGDKEKIKDFVPNLGNLTLLSKKSNTIIQNESFSKKKYTKDKKDNKSGYSESRLVLNTETVCKYDQWTATIITERADLFFDLADKIWDLNS